MPITNIPVSGEFLNIQDLSGPSKEVATPGFSDHLKAFIKDVNHELHHAEQVSQDFADGKINNIHETIMAAEKASIAFKLVGSVRAKVLEAYQEVMRMPL